MNMYKTIIRPFLFSFTPEFSHKIVENILFFTPEFFTKIFFYNKEDSRLAVNLFGKLFLNPIGVAAGLDKDCKTASHYINMGFGYSVVGTVMTEPRKGSEKPRLIRNNKEQSLLNSLSFPSDGAKVIKNRILRLAKYKEKILVSVAGISMEDVIRNIKTFKGDCFAFEINISSPNSEKLKSFNNPESIESILKNVRGITPNPILIKLPRLEDLSLYTELIYPMTKFKNVGVVLANSLPIEENVLKAGRGGKSGKPLFASTLNILKIVRSEFPEICIVCSGGIFSPQDVWGLLEEGANAVQMYTSIIYEGPGIAKKLKKGLIKLLDENKVDNLQNIIN